MALGLGLPALVALCWIAGHRHDQHIASLRSGESICNFARSFARRSVDPWILRATYEELATRFPIRADDRFEQDLCIDDEELEFEAKNIASRAQRSLERAETNPLFGKITTVRDLVLFLDHQPPLRELREAQQGAAPDECPQARARG